MHQSPPALWSAIPRPGDWGYWLGQRFIVLPKVSLVHFGIPPFDVTKPDGTVVHVIEYQPKEQPDATEKRLESEDDLGEHSDGTLGGEAGATGSGDCGEPGPDRIERLEENYKEGEVI